MDDVEEQVSQMMDTLKTIVATKPEVKIAPKKMLNEVQEDWTNYCQNFALRVAALPNEDSRDGIRIAMENMYYQHKKKFSVSEL